MTNPLRYDLPENHVDLRSGVSDELRQRMFNVPRESWERNPAFRGEAEFWLEIHKGLLGASDTLATWAQEFLCEPGQDARVMLARRICLLGTRVVHHAHGHHDIEDHHFFPLFLRAFPQLARPLELLDGDHKVLGIVLDDLEKSIAALASRESFGPEARDGLMSDGENLLAAAKRLDALFRRHINDEEEICVPAMLQG